jgi:hypothetical protein
MNSYPLLAAISFICLLTIAGLLFFTGLPIFIVPIMTLIGLTIVFGIQVLNRI